MRTAAVIAEFNPFHNGHAYLINEIKKSGYDAVIAVMSGSFCQRGEVAVASKFERASAALHNGVDMVIELPAVWAVSGAQSFARGAVDTIAAAGCADTLFFGSECGDIGQIQAVADAMESESVNSLVKELMRDGMYYPLAVQTAVSQLCGDTAGVLLSGANNTLAVEYCRRLSGTGIDACTVKRIGCEHDSSTACGRYASASHIRDLIFRSKDVSAYMPEGYGGCANPAFESAGERAVLYKLRTMTAQQLLAVADTGEGLNNRIYEAARRYDSVSEILSAVKTKRYTHARLRRIITCLLLSVTGELQSREVGYIRVLGFTPIGERLLRQLSSSAAVPVIVNVADCYKLLEPHLRELFDIDIAATDIRTVFEKMPSPCGGDYSHGVIRVL